MAAAEAERSSRAEAQGQSETLKAESERRARVFNNAVKTAVSKVQRELEAERDELQVRFFSPLVRAVHAHARAHTHTHTQHGRDGSAIHLNPYSRIL
jgi:hypothetical protein